MTGKSWTLLAAVLGSGIVFLDSTVVGVALPAIGREQRLFVGVLEGQTYVRDGYLLTLSALIILAGALTDFYGRRRLFAIGLAGFGATSLLCGLAPNVELLILFRLLQGVAGAILVPGSLALLTAGFTGQEQGRAFGIWAAASAGTTILGPFVGGVLVDTISWRAVFLINLPLVAIALLATLRHVPESRNEQASGSFDWFGALLIALAVGGLAFGGVYGQSRQWRDQLAFFALGLGALATVSMPFYFARARNPLIPLGLFRSRNFSVTNLSTLLIYGALYVAFGYLPLLLQGTLGYTAAAVGLATMPGSLFLVFLSSRFGAAASRFGPRWFMAVGPIVMALGVLWLARLPAGVEAWRLSLAEPATWLPPGSYFGDILPALGIFGFGLAVMVAPLTTALMRSVPVSNSGLASAINNAVSRVGPQLAGALIFVVLTAAFYASLGDRLPGVDVASAGVRAVIQPLNAPRGVPPAQAEAARAASVDAFHLAMLVSALLLAAGALINGLGIRQEQAREDGSEKAGAESAPN